MYVCVYICRYKLLPWYNIIYLPNKTMNNKTFTHGKAMDSTSNQWDKRMCPFLFPETGRKLAKWWKYRERKKSHLNQRKSDNPAQVQQNRKLKKPTLGLSKVAILSILKSQALSTGYVPSEANWSVHPMETEAPQGGPAPCCHAQGQTKQTTWGCWPPQLLGRISTGWS